MLILAFGEPDGGDVGVGEALFEFCPLRGVGGAAEDGVVVRERVGTDILRHFGKGLDGPVAAQDSAKKKMLVVRAVASWVSNASTNAISSSAWEVIEGNVVGLMPFDGF